MTPAEKLYTLWAKEELLRSNSGIPPVPWKHLSDEDRRRWHRHIIDLLQWAVTRNPQDRQVLLNALVILESRGNV